jgi:chemotaxis protein CheC
MLNDQQLAALSRHFCKGSEDASQALSRWLGRPARVSIEQIEQVPLGEATAVLGDPECPICFCAMALEGRLTGELILSFDDASGLALADLLLERSVGKSIQWGEIETSAALETANIIGCAYLNALASSMPESAGAGQELLPSPPRFARDFAESLMQFALMSQASVSDVAFLTRTEFHIDDTPVDCNLLFVPDAENLSALREWLSK